MEMMKSTAGVGSLQWSLPLWAVFLWRFPSSSSYVLHVAQHKSTDVYTRSSPALKPDAPLPPGSDFVYVCVHVQILHLAGGLGRLQLDPPSDPVVVELQDIVRSHIEKTWLPRFLSTAEFSERQKHQLKVNEVTGLRQRPEEPPLRASRLIPGWESWVELR